MLSPNEDKQGNRCEIKSFDSSALQISIDNPSVILALLQHH